MPRPWDDPKYKSDDCWHRVWVNDTPGRIDQFKRRGYRPDMEGGGKLRDDGLIEPAHRVETPVGHERIAVLMEIPQATFHGVILANLNRYADEALAHATGRVKPQGEAIRDWQAGRKPVDYDEWNVWSPWRILHFPAPGHPFRGLFNISRQHRAIRVAFRYHNDAYWYVRLRWRPWKWTCERRTRFTENARLDAKYPEMAGEPARPDEGGF